MKKVFFTLLVFTVVLNACDSIHSAKGKLDEGKITYEIDLSGTDMNIMQRKIMEMMKLTIAFRQNLMRTELNMGVGETRVIIDGNANSGLMLLSAMGNKMAVRMKPEDIEKKQQQRGSYTVEYADEEKEIAGYKCKKAIVKTAKDEILTLYYSDEIAPAKANTDFTFKEIKGFPLEMEINLNGMIVKMTASAIDPTPLPENYFSMEIPEGYTESDSMPFGGM